MIVKKNDNLRQDETQNFIIRSDSYSPAESIITIISIAVGTGPTKLGYIYRCGIILGPLLSIIFGAITMYNCWIFCVLAGAVKASTFDEIWAKIYNKPTSTISTTVAVAVSVLVMMFYFDFISSSVISLFEIYFPNIPQIFLVNYTILIIVALTLEMFFVFTHNLRVITSVMKFKMFIIAYLIFIIIYKFCSTVIKEGFDPKHQLVYFNFHHNFVSTCGSLFTFYLSFPIAWPGLNNFKENSVKSLVKTFSLATIILFVIYNVMGIFSYFTFFNQNEGGIVFDYYENGWLKTTGYLSLIVSNILSIPFVMNPGRYLLIKQAFPIQDIPKNIWIFIGICEVIISLFISTTYTKFGTVLWIICDAFTPIILCVIPSLLFMKFFGKKHPLHFVLCIIDFIIGIVFTVILVALYFI